MYLDLMDILRAPGTSLERTIDLPPVVLDDVSFVDRIRGRVRAANARRSIVISGRAASRVEMRCSRCLQLFEQPLDMELEASAPVSFFRATPNSVVKSPKSPRNDEDGEDEDEVDDETAAIFDAHSVDVLELLRQAAVLNWPIQPLCSENCGGLPEAEKFKLVQSDDRWSALAALAVPEASGSVADEPGADEVAALGDEDSGEDSDEFADDDLESLSDAEIENLARGERSTPHGESLHN